MVLVTTIIGSAAAILDGLVVNLALPKIGHDFHAGFSALQWITDGYLLSLSALILLGGSLGDIVGRKKIYLIGLAGFGVSSLLCAFAPDAGMLIGFRLVQGVFGALLVPGALSIINTNIAARERGKAIGRWTAWSSVATVLGPVVGGLVLNLASWRWIFIINVPVVAVCLMLAAVSVRETRDSAPRRIDWRGAGVAAAALLGVTFGLIQGPATHWRPDAVLSLAAGTVLAGLFVRIESRRRDPMVPLRLFASRHFSGANLMTFAMYGALGGLTFSLVIYLQTRMHYSSLAAGFSLLPTSIVMFLFAGRVGALCARYGPRRFMTAGPLVASLGILWFYYLRPGDSYAAGILPGALLFSAGLVLTVAPLTITVMAAVPETASGIASGINNAVARAAGLVVIAVLGLFGAQHEYRFAMALCAGLAALAGVLSFAMITGTPRPGPASKKENT